MDEAYALRPVPWLIPVRWLHGVCVPWSTLLGLPLAWNGRIKTQLTMQEKFAKPVNHNQYPLVLFSSVEA